jgi:hypothetical protein
MVRYILGLCHGSSAIYCFEYKEKNANSPSGIYKISTISDNVYCDQTNDGGGWTILIKVRDDNNINFDRSWLEYKKFFGDLNKSFWLGLENMNKLTNLGNTQMYVDEIFKGLFYQYQYSYLNIGDEAQSYAISIPDGNINGMKFTTKDRDNDNYPTNCSDRFKSGWWYNACYLWKLTGDLFNTVHGLGINFENLHSTFTQSISYGIMKIRRRKLL